MKPSERYEERLTTLAETFEYADRVVRNMPRRTAEERKARAEKYLAILAEWHAARVRWKITQP